MIHSNSLKAFERLRETGRYTGHKMLVIQALGEMGVATAESLNRHLSLKGFPLANGRKYDPAITALKDSGIVSVIGSRKSSSTGNIVDEYCLSGRVEELKVEVKPSFSKSGYEELVPILRKLWKHVDAEDRDFFSMFAHYAKYRANK